MGRSFMKFKTAVLNTELGKFARDVKVKTSFKEKKASQMIDKHFGETISKDEKARLMKDMLHEAKTYMVGFDEYIMYHFNEKSETERREFIPSRERAKWCEAMNNPKNQLLFDDKGETYKVFKKYYKRDLAEVLKYKNEEKINFNKFIELHPKFIIKPFNGGNGRGICILNAAEYESFNKFWEFLRGKYENGFVAEELIIQAKELSAMHPESVNTLRITTLRTNNEILILYPLWRVGRGKSVVDNAGSGGIICRLDANGTVIDICDENGDFYDVHPDTGKALIGFTIPRFEEAKKLALELSGVVPDNRYCGWDLALTDDGWIMQEGNWQGAFTGWQALYQKGFRSELRAIFDEIGLSWPK